MAVLLLTPAVLLDAAEKSAASGDETGPPGKSYVYKQSGGKPRELEIYFPPNHDPTKAKVPGAILFHGGAWKGGDLRQFRAACRYLASRGLVTATANYRKLNANDLQQLPAGESYKRVCITDAKSAIRWFKQHAGEFGVDPQRIVTGGGSAGGHVCVLATINPGLNDPADPLEIDTSVVAYLLFNPAFSITDATDDAEIDALRHLRADFAPAIVFFGALDGSWRKGWDAVQDNLRTLGNTTTELQVAEGQTHGFFNRDPWQTVTLIAADRFLAQHGLLKGKPTLTSPATGERMVTVPECATEMDLHE